MAQESENNTGQPLPEFANLETNLSTPQDTEPLIGSSNQFGFGVDNKLDMPGPAIMNNVVGYPPNIPGGQQIGNTKNAFKDFIAASSQDISDDEGKSSYGKMFNYDAGPDGNNFYDRYAAYGDDKFAEVGFHPFRDNQANFNANTTLWNDMSVMMRHSFPVLLKRGFVDGPKSFARALSGDFTGADLESAEEYSRAAAMGQSTRGGIGAFFNNTLMNFGYTAGIISEAILEEVALSFVTAGSGGTGGGLQAVRTADILKDIGQGVGKFKTGVTTGKQLLSKVSKNPNAARTFWETARGKKLASVGKLLNPLENTTAALKAAKTDKYLTGMARLSATPGAFYRDARNLNMAISESRLEAGMVENKIFDKLYSDHYKEFGKAPDSNTQYAMRQKAKQGSLETFYANAGIIYLTNQITFGNITSPKGGLNNFLKQTRKEIYEVGAKSGEKQFGTLGKVIFDNTKKAFVFEKNNFLNLAKSWWKQPGYATAKNTLGYFKSNVSEGIQENLQEIIARANEQNYIQAYKMQASAASLYGKGVNNMSYQIQSGLPFGPGTTSSAMYGEELSKEFGSQGFETFMSGFLMGTFSKPLNAAMPFLSTQKARIFNKEEFESWKKDKLKITKGIVENLNKLDIDALINNRLINLGTQEQVSLIQKKGSKKEALDAEVDSFVSTMGLMRRTGTTDVFIEKLKSMQEMTDEELADDVKSLEVKDMPKYRKRIANAINKLSAIEDNFKEAEEIFPSPVDVDRISADELKTPEGQALVRLNNAWQKSVENYVYLNVAFKDTAARMNDINNTYLEETSLKDVNYGAAKVLFQPVSISRQVGILEQELAVEQQKDDVPQAEKSKNIKSKKAQIKALKEFQTAQAIFYGFYQRNETPTINLAKKRLKEDGIEDPSDEQIQEKLTELLGDITDEKQQTLINKNLKAAHDKYLRSLADENNATVFSSNLDKAYNKLVDFYKLEFEKRAIAEHIDLLSNPSEFLKLVLENEKVGEKIKAQMNQLNSEIVDEQVNKVALDQLLNTLANNAPPLYMDKDQVINLLQRKEVPEFFTGIKNEIYEPGSEPYRQGKEYIEEYNEISNILTSNIDEATGVEMTVEMKKSVEDIKKVFKDSKDILGYKKGYIKNGNIYSRVSNVMDKLFKDKGYNRLEQLAKTKDIVFTADDGSFTFTQEGIDQFIKEIKKDIKAGFYGTNDGGITDETVSEKNTLSELRLELESLLNGKILNSYQKQISELETGKTKYQDTVVAANNIKLIDEEISKLSANKYSKEEITSEVLIDVINNIMPLITYEAGRVRGISLDDMVRDYFDPQSELKYDNYKDKISEDAFVALFGETGHLAKLKAKAANGEIYIFSKDLKISDDNLYNKDGKKLGNVAGALDLMIVDKTGKKYIVDLKTGSAQKWDSYLTPGEKNYNYKKYFQNSMQQRAYANLYFNNSKEDVETLILPISLKEDKTGYITEFNNIPDRVFRNQKTLDNIVDGYMFMKTDNNARIKSGDAKIKVTDIDQYIPKESAGETPSVPAEASTTPENLTALEKRAKDIEEQIKELKRKRNVDIGGIEELQDELNAVKKDIKTAKKTPDAEEDEDKEYYKNLRTRRSAAFKNIIETTSALRDRVFVETEYESNTGELIKIKNEALLTNPKVTDEDALEIATNKVEARIEQLYRYDILNHKRKYLIENTVDNLTGRVFNSEIGKIFDKKLNQWGEEGALQRIKIDSVYVTDEGNYGILAKNLRRDRLYDMVVTPEGEVLSHNNKGAIGQKTDPNISLSDVIFFEEGDFARKKTEEDKVKKTDEDDSPQGFQVTTDLSDKAKAKLNKLGFTKDMLKIMTAEEIELAKTFSEASEAKEMQDSLNAKLETVETDSIAETIGIVGDADVATLAAIEEALETLKSDLEFEKGEYGDSEIVSVIEAQIKQIEEEKNKIIEAQVVIDNKAASIGIVNEQDIRKDKQLSIFGETRVSLNELVKDINNDSKTNTSKMYDALEDLYLSEEIDKSKYQELKKLLDLKSNAILETNQLINSGNIYTFKKSLDSKKIKVGDQIRVQKLDGSNKKIVVKKLGRGNFKPFLMTVSDFESMIDFGDPAPPKKGTGKKEIEETGDVLQDFLTDKKAQYDVDSSTKNFFDDTNDENIFNNCE